MAITLRRRRKIAKKLLAYGEESFECCDSIESSLANNNPNGYLFAVILDQGVQAEKAWGNISKLMDRLGTNRLGRRELRKIARMSTTKLKRLMGRYPALHRWPRKVAPWLKSAAQQLLDHFSGNANRIWNNTPRAKDVIRAFEDFEGIGQKKSTMAANLLYRAVGIPMRRLRDIDVSVDINVQRVFMRAGLASSKDKDEIIESARQLNPRFPGELDWPAYDIGRNWCLKEKAYCEDNEGDCPLVKVCPKLFKNRI